MGRVGFLAFIGVSEIPKRVHRNKGIKGEGALRFFAKSVTRFLETLALGSHDFRDLQRMVSSSAAVRTCSHEQNKEICTR